MQTDRERRPDVLLISEQYKWSEISTQDASRRTGILVCNLDCGVEDILESDGKLVWVEVTEMCVYICFFSSNDPFEVFVTLILLLEESLSESVGWTLIAGNFNSKSPEWGEAWRDRRRILVGNMIARNDLIVLSRGQNFKFRRGAILSRKGCSWRREV